MPPLTPGIILATLIRILLEPLIIFMLYILSFFAVLHGIKLSLAGVSSFAVLHGIKLSPCGIVILFNVCQGTKVS